MMSRRVYLKSSNVDYVAYDDEEWIMEVGFKWGGIYDYSHVEPSVWYNILNAPSPGKFIWDEIRRPDRFPYELQNYGPEEVISEKVLPPESRKKPWWRKIFPFGS